MGASEFTQIGHGATAEEAFAHAREQAGWERGHGGYSGTVYEKDSFVMIEKKPLPLAEAYALAERLITEYDPRINDKWGPAGCVPVVEVSGATAWTQERGGERVPLNGGDKQRLFFGMASC